MAAGEHLGRYAEGWTKGDAEIILSATADGFTFDDPNVGKVSTDGFAQYLAGVQVDVKQLTGGSLPDPYMQLTEVVTQEADGVLTAWCWWEVPGADLKGSGLIKVTDAGVQSEVITYYAMGG